MIIMLFVLEKNHHLFLAFFLNFLEVSRRKSILSVNLHLKHLYQVSS